MQSNIAIKSILLKDLNYEQAAALIRETFSYLKSNGIYSPKSKISSEKLIKENYSYCFGWCI